MQVEQDKPNEDTQNISPLDVSFGDELKTEPKTPFICMSNEQVIDLWVSKYWPLVDARYEKTKLGNEKFIKTFPTPKQIHVIGYTPTPKQKEVIQKREEYINRSCHKVCLIIEQF